MAHVSDPQTSRDLPKQSFGAGLDGVWFRRLRGSLMVVLGYLLSPLSWWNDLIFNLPVAYGVGYLANLLFPGHLLVFTIAGYWLSNVAGILLMQFGLVEVWQDAPQERNFKKDLITGVASSTAYTLVIFALVHFHILDMPDLSGGGSEFSLSAFLSKFNNH